MDLIERIHKWGRIASRRAAHIAEGRILTYEQLCRQSDALASHLLVAQLYERGEQWQEAAGSYLQALALADARAAVVACEEDERGINGRQNGVRDLGGEHFAPRLRVPPPGRK